MGWAFRGFHRLAALDATHYTLFDCLGDGRFPDDGRLQGQCV